MGDACLNDNNKQQLIDPISFKTRAIVVGEDVVAVVVVLDAFMHMGATTSMLAMTAATID